MKVTIEEEPRVFQVSVGRLEIGKVTSYAEKGVVPDGEVYHAEVFVDTDERNKSLGWFPTWVEAARAVVDLNYGPCKFGKIKERIV